MKLPMQMRLYCVAAVLLGGAVLRADRAFATPPAITGQPQRQTIAAGSNAVFTATVTGSPVLTFQWTFNGTNLSNTGRISGATTSSLTISNVVAADKGLYQLAVTNAEGGLVSSNAALSVAAFSEVVGAIVDATRGTAQWVDYDNDGYLDLFISGYNAGFNPQTRLYHNNHDGTFSEVASGLPNWAESSADWADFDGDGYVDVVMSGTPGGGYFYASVYRNVAGTNFVSVASLNAYYSGGGAVWCDVDNDGRPDAISSTFLSTWIYHNNGDGSFSLATNLTGGTVAPADYDNDGWNDLFIFGSVSYGGARLYRNTGANTFTNIGLTVSGLSSGMGAWGDYNNDGYADLLLSAFANSGSGATRLFKNNSGVLTSLGDLDSLRDGTVAWGDFDNDGKLDFFNFGLVLGCCYKSKVYRNAGNDTFVDQGFSLPGVSRGCAAWGDYDNDGALDLVYLGDKSSVSLARLYHNDGAIPDHPPTIPTGLTVTIGFNSAVLSWNASTDLDQSGGLTYNVQMGTSNGLVDVVSPLADLNTGFRRVPKFGNAGYRTSYIITNLPGGTYYCSVQSIDHAFKGSQFSSTVGFTLPAPVITNQPQSQTVNSGMPVTFLVGASGPDPKFYQWSFNGAALAGATNESLSINTTGLSDQGVYSVVVSNQYGRVISSNANLTVLTPPSFTQQPASQSNGMGGYTFFSGMATGSVPISYQWYFNGSPLVGADDWGATSNNLTIIRTIPDYAGEYFLVASNAYGSVTSSVVSLTVQVPTSLLNVDFGSGTQSLKTGPAAMGQTAADFWNFYDGTYIALTNLTLAQQIPTATQVIMTGPRGLWTNSNPDPMFGRYLYQNGLPGTLQVTTLGLPKGNYDLFYYSDLSGGFYSTTFQLFVDGINQGTKGPGSADFIGTIDVNSTNWVEGIHFVAFRNVAINTNSNVRVVVGWQVAGYGATIAGMQISPALTQPQVPLYWTQPKGGIYSPGSAVVLGATVTGQSPTQYQWYRDGVSLTDDAQVTGTTSNVLTITSSSTNHTGNYWLVATNPAGSNSSFVARIFVGLPPSVSVQPHSQTNLVGSNVAFTVSIAGTPPFSYHWRKNSANLSDGGRISGSLTGTLTLTNLQSTDAAQYSVVVTNEAGTITSAGANLTVWTPPSITQQPVGKTVLGGSNVTFIGDATGTTPLRYQWFKNESPISAAVDRTLALSNVRRSDSGAYAFVVTNVAGAVTSATANLIVHVPQRLTFVIATNGSPLFQSSDMDGGPLVDPDLSSFFLQTSSNLVQWTTITNGLSYTNGEFTILPPAPSPSVQFYRIFEVW